MSSLSFWGVSRLALAGCIAIGATSGFAQAQRSFTTNDKATKAAKETVLYSFSGGADGANPNAGVIIGSDGALYGTTVYGGTFGSGGAGVVYKLTLQGHKWTRTLLHVFSSAPDGVNPFAGVIFGSDGALYGTTVFGGNPGNGTVYKLTPSAMGGTLWSETVLYSFTGGADGANPSNGSLILDSSGALYGTTINGGSSGNGTVYKLAPPATGRTLWNKTVLYSFTAGADGRYGSSSLIFDSSGALYGTAAGGGNGSGTVYKLTPPASGTVWSLTVLYAFAAVTNNNGGPDGAFPSAGPLILDSNGALYGTTRAGGPCQGCGLGFGTVYKVTPPAVGAPTGTPWTEAVIYNFAGASDGYGPNAGVLFDSSGALYGTTTNGGAGWGTVFKLTPPVGGMPPGTPWTKTILYNFLNTPDGNGPFSGLIFDRHGTIYGTTAGGGSGIYPYNGTVFQVVQ